MLSLLRLKPFSGILSKQIRHTSCATKLIRKDSVKNILQESEESQTSIQVNGWARKVLKKKVTSFVHLDDGTSIQRLQVVVPKDVLKDRRLYAGQALACTGKLVPSPGPQQAMELLCDSIEIVGDCNPKEYEIGNMHKMDVDYLRTRIHMRPRVRYFQAINRVRSDAMMVVQMFMLQNGFVQVNTPMITANDCEGGGQCFSVQSNNHKDYFSRNVFLTVSGQLHLETMAASLSRVWTFGPVFRAEKSMSPKHVSEFLMLEAEEAFMNKLNPLLDRVESLIKFLAMLLEQRCEEDLKFLRAENNYTLFNMEERFKRITYEDALEMLKNTPEFQDKEITHLNSQMERKLVELMDNVPVFVTHYPFELKPFYMKTDDNGNALCFDLLMPNIGEVAGGSLREDSLEKLENNIATKLNDSNRQHLEWYLDLRRFGHTPTGGFGIGFDRLIQALTGTANIKDIVPFPRWPYHCHL